MNGKEVSQYKKGYILHLTLLIGVIVMMLITTIWNFNLLYTRKQIKLNNQIDERIYRMEEMYRFYYGRPYKCNIYRIDSYYALEYKGEKYYYKLIPEFSDCYLRIEEYYGTV